MPPSTEQDTEHRIPDPPMPVAGSGVGKTGEREERRELPRTVGSIPPSPGSSSEVREKLLRLQEIQTELGRLAPLLWELVGPAGQWQRVRRCLVPVVLLGSAIWPGILAVTAIAVEDWQAASVLGTLTFLLGGSGAGLAVLAGIDLRRKGARRREIEEQTSQLAAEETALRSQLLAGAGGVPLVSISSAERLGRAEAELAQVRDAMQGFARGFVGASAESRKVLLEREQELVAEIALLSGATPGTARALDRQPEWYAQMVHDRLPLGPSPREALAALGAEAPAWRVWFHRHIGWGLASASFLAITLLVLVRIAHHVS